MKKLLILVLVVGLASVSYGQLVTLTDFSAVLSGTTLTIHSNIALGAGSNIAVGLYDVASGPGDALSGGTILGSPATAGALKGLIVNSTNPDFGIDFTAGSTGSEVPAWDAQIGNWYSVTWTGIAVGDLLEVSNISGSTYNVVGNIAVTPEPMTIALLGLGGLLLRRRMA